MQTSLQVVSRTRRLCYAAAFLSLALMLSLAESVLFPTGILPIPGAKPGLANAAVLLCAAVLGVKYAGSVSLCRIALMFILFGNGSSVIYSLSGALASFVGIAAFVKSEKLSFLGKSVISAVLHNGAQLFCATAVFKIPALSLLPWMILAGVVCGGFTGIVLNLSYGAFTQLISRIFGHNG